VPSDTDDRFTALFGRAPADESTLSIEELRAADGAWAMAATEPDGVVYRPVDAGGIAAEWTVPEGADPERVLLYLHGGGYSLGSIRSHRRLVGHLAKAAGAPAFSVEYRLAPEHPFPDGLEDAVTSYSWLLEQGLDPAHVALGGDSSGGGLALATALAVRERGLPGPAGLVLLSPWTDLASTGASLAGKIDAARVRRIAWYAGDKDVRDPLISPLYADFTGFAPFVVHVGGAELLLDDSTRLAERAEAAGCEVAIEIWPEMPHVFQLAAGNVVQADASVAALGAWLSKRLAG